MQIWWYVALLSIWNLSTFPLCWSVLHALYDIWRVEWEYWPSDNWVIFYLEIHFFSVLFTINVIYFKWKWSNAVDIYSALLIQMGVSSDNAECTPMRFQLFMGEHWHEILSAILDDVIWSTDRCQKSNITRILEENMSDVVVSTGPADGLAPNGHWSLIKLMSPINTGRIIQNQHFNTLRPRRNRCHFADGIFKWIFVNENVWITIKISLKFIPKGPINNYPSLYPPQRS